MAYEHRQLNRQKVLYSDTNDGNPLVYQLVVDGAKVTPTSATIATYAPGETTATLAATAMTLTGSILTYELNTTTVADYPIASGYRAEIVVTYNSDTLDRHIMFDVVKYLLDYNIGYDQLVAFDSRLRGMLHDGDDDFSELIESSRDVLQVMLETKTLEDGALIENMVLDSTKLAIPARFYILSQIFLTKGDDETSDKYMERFEESWRMVANSIKYDKDQDGFESAKQGGIQTMRLRT